MAEKAAVDGVVDTGRALPATGGPTGQFDQPRKAKTDLEFVSAPPIMPVHTRANFCNRCTSAGAYPRAIDQIPATSAR